MRRHHPRTVSVTNEPEIELQWEASVSPIVPAVTQADPEFCHPEEGGEVEDVRLVLGVSQIKSMRKLLAEFVAAPTATDAHIEEFVQDILELVLDAKVQPDDDEFREAAEREDDADEAAEDDAREERDREERHDA